jgi:hypothetical protein
LENFSGTSDPDEAKATIGRAVARTSSSGQSFAGRFRIEVWKRAFDHVPISQPSQQYKSDLRGSIGNYRNGNKAFVFAGEPPLTSDERFQGRMAQTTSKLTVVQIRQKRLAPVLFIELNVWGRCIGLRDNRSAPTRFDFDGIVLEVGRYHYRLFHADHTCSFIG